MATAESVKARHPVVWTSAIIIVVGALVGWLLGESSTIVVVPVEGVTVFALFYVLAQALERINEGAGKALAVILPSAPQAAKDESVRRLRGIEAIPADSSTADEKAKLARSRTESSLLTGAFSFAFAFGLTGYFHAGLLTVIGVQDLNPVFDRFLTALAIMGGTKGLHDLISKVEKSKESEETKPAAA